MNTDFSKLSERQLKIFRALAAGCNVKSCAFLFATSPKTVEHHWASIKRKLRINTTVEAAHLGLRFGVVDNLFAGRELLEPPTKKKP